MDVLILHGMYDETIAFLDAYRKLRPDGKVYCGLDMNSAWMKNILWGSEKVQKFATQCDIIATSCTSLRDELNINSDVNFPCRFISNAFFNSKNTPISVSVGKKSNTILTVGRIGTAQKNNQELMIAFANIEHYIPKWTLKLVGSVESSFDSFIDEYFEYYPHLRERVIFTGAIYEKQKLYAEYEKAKIFVLTSQFEGGTPNVYAEALCHGCSFITSKIDAANDITNFGILGEIYNVGETTDLAVKLLERCMKLENTLDDTYIQKALAYGERWFSWERNGKKLAFSLFL